ncbi:MAG: DinB family protein [Thermomicrobiales bacterium]
MSRNDLSSAEVLVLLATTPQRLAALTAGVDSVELQGSPDPNEWSGNDTLAHLRACADVWGGCIARILSEDEPSWRAVNPRTWIVQTDYRDLEFHASLRAFVQQRRDLLVRLEPLPPDDWLRAATVSGEGKIRQRDVFFYARRMARHELTHVKQMARIIERIHEDG